MEEEIKWGRLVLGISPGETIALSSPLPSLVHVQVLKSTKGQIRLLFVAPKHVDISRPGKTAKKEGL